MSSPELHNIPDSGADISDVELDRLLSWGVEQLAGLQEPPAHVWEEIRSKLQAGPSPARHPARRTAIRSAPLAQALAVASLLVVLGLSLGPVLQWPRFPYGSGEAIDALTRTRVTQIEPSGPPLHTEEGLLNEGKILRWEREQARQQEVITRDTSPSVDPILTYHQEWRRRDLPR